MFNSVMISFVKIFFMNLCIMFSYIKINKVDKLDRKSLLEIFLTNIIICCIYTIVYEEFHNVLEPITLNLFCYAFFSIIVSSIIKTMRMNRFLIILLSIFLSTTTFILSGIVVFSITRIQLLRNIIDTVFEYLIIGIVQMIIVYYFFKIKRFKNGFYFLGENVFFKNIIVSILSITIIILIVYTISKNYWVEAITFSSVILAMVLVKSLIKDSITNHYKSQMKDRTVEYLNEQLQEKDKIIENLKTDLDKTLKINHKYNHRISAMERAIVKAKFNEEFAEENNEIINLVKELAKDYKNETFEAESKLPKTNVFSIDNILEYMANKANNDNIEFQVDVKCNIKDLITNIVNQSKLATLLADHINDAIIAINYSGNELRKILVVFDKIDDIYEIKIYDTGIEFEIETLLKLGKEQVTTHKDSGGTGIGFMTTFETLKESKGSLIIEEDNSEDYSKAIIIKFDNKCEYKIHSYRADEIREQNKNSNIIIEKI